MPLTDRDYEVLGELEAANRNLAQFGREWVQPLDCGGSNGSDHSYRLNKLAKHGLVNAGRRAGWSRGSKKYQITEAGRAALAARKSTSK